MLNAVSKRAQYIIFFFHPQMVRLEVTRDKFDVQIMESKMSHTLVHLFRITEY